jgi:formate dehydrogenase major subunit
MQTVRVTINGKEYAAEAGKTILDVVREHNADEIPTLCHDPKLPPYGSCYLCVVQIQGMEKLVPSCSSPVSDGMVVQTDNDRIRQSRRTALELLLSNHYADCLGPCTRTCPAGVDVQGYIALISAGRYREAVRLIKEKNPLPVVCGRVCVRECENACRRNLVDERIGIDYLKRFVSDIDLEDPWVPVPAPKNGKKVAIVGGGPAGLTCAYYLALDGYDLALFEQNPALGGMLRYGIPEYRLPKKSLDKEIKWITDLGVDVKTNVSLGKDVTLDALKKEFDAVFVAIGAQKPKSMGIAGEESVRGVLKGADFLHEVQTDNPPKLHGKVVVVGGGNTAVDAARTALRVGADEVTMVYRRTQKEMPAHHMEVEAAEEEGVKMVFLSAPLSIVENEGRVKALTCNRMELGEPDASGRRSPVPVPGSEYDLPCDFIVSAIGQDVDPGNMGSFQCTRQKAIVINKDTFETSVPGVFAGGDAVTGPAVAIDAIAHGKKAAFAIDLWVRSGMVEKSVNGFISRKEAFGEIPQSEFAHIKKAPKEKMAELPAAERVKGFTEVELGFTEKQALQEAARCLECGCSSYFDCELRMHASRLNVDIDRFAGNARRYKIDRAHPFIDLDPNKCINCGRCVRTCSEILRIAALGFVNRGFKAVVKPSMEKPLLSTTCISCGNCVTACPTGAISEKLPFPKPGPWSYAESESVCAFCSLGCTLKYRVFHDHAFTVSGSNGASHNKGYLCTKGRFGYRYMLENNRLLKPLVKKKGHHVETGWQEAIDQTASRLKSIIAAHGPESVAVFASQRLTNEELYLLQKLVREGLKTNNIGSLGTIINGVEQDALDDMIGMTVSTAATDDLQKADVILVINAELSADNLIAELKVKAAQKRGAGVIVVNSSETPLTKLADLWIDSKRGTNTALINGLCSGIISRKWTDRSYVKARTEGYADVEAAVSGMDDGIVSEITGVDRGKLVQLLDMLGKPGQNVVVLYNIDAVWEKSRNDLKAIANMMMLTGRIGKPGNGIVIVRDYANSQGLVDMGVDSYRLPGHVAAQGNGKRDLKNALERETIKAALIFGEDPFYETANMKLMGGVEFLVVADHFMTSTAVDADVVFPASLPVETNGTYTSCDRRIQKTAKLFEPATGKENWQVIKEIAKALGIELKARKTEDITREIEKKIPAYRGATGGFWGNGLFARKFPTENGKAKFVPAEIDITPCNIDKKSYLSSEHYFNVKVRGKLTN